jgi:hypothetical protein
MSDIIKIENFIKKKLAADLAAFVKSTKKAKVKIEIASPNNMALENLDDFSITFSCLGDGVTPEKLMHENIKERFSVILDKLFSTAASGKNKIVINPLKTSLKVRNRQVTDKDGNLKFTLPTITAVYSTSLGVVQVRDRREKRIQMA